MAAKKTTPKKKTAKKTKVAAKKKTPKKVGKKKVVANKKMAKKVSANHGSKVTLRGGPVSTSGRLPAKGAQTPAFTLTTGALQDISNKDLLGKRVILNIFPSIDTPTCATSTRTFNELASALNNTDVYCVSADLPFAQGRFCGVEGLANVKTASSFRSNFGKALGVTILDGVLKGVLARAVVVLDEKGKVLHSQLVSEIANEPNYDAAINSLK
jgi:thiol peroxidase